MAEQRPEPTESVLREAKDQLVSDMADHARQVGNLPDVRAMETFLDPILRKVEVDQREERARDQFRPSKPKRQKRTTTLDGADVEVQSAGDWEWDLRTDKLRQVGGPKQQFVRPEGPATRKARECFRLMYGDPQFTEWKERVMKVVLSTKPAVWKAQQYRTILKQFVRAYGDPTLRPEKRIMVGGGRR